GLPDLDVLVLDEQSANRLYRLPLAGRDHLLLSDAPVYLTPDGQLVLHPGQERSRLSLLPAPAALMAGSGAGRRDRCQVEPERSGAGPWRSWTVCTPDAGRVPAQ